MTAPRTDPQSTVPVEPLSAHAAAQEFWRGKCIDCAHPEHEMTCGETVPNGDPSNGPAYCPCAAQMEWMEAEIIRLRAAARASQPITATDPRLEATKTDLLAEVLRRCMGTSADDNRRHDFGDMNGGALQRPSEVAAELMRALGDEGLTLAALPVREDEPTGIDVERLVETTRALVNALDYVPGSQIGGLIALVIAALPREASHVR